MCAARCPDACRWERRRFDVFAQHTCRGALSRQAARERAYARLSERVTRVITSEREDFCIVQIKGGGPTLAPALQSQRAQRIYSCSQSRSVETPGSQPAPAAAWPPVAKHSSASSNSVALHTRPKTQVTAFIYSSAQACAAAAAAVNRQPS